MGKMDDQEFNWESENEDDDEPWKKAHNEWKNHSEI